MFTSPIEIAALDPHVRVRSANALDILRYALEIGAPSVKVNAINPSTVLTAAQIREAGDCGLSPHGCLSSCTSWRRRHYSCQPQRFKSSLMTELTSRLQEKCRQDALPLPLGAGRPCSVWQSTHSALVEHVCAEKRHAKIAGVRQGAEPTAQSSSSTLRSARRRRGGGCHPCGFRRGGGSRRPNCAVGRYRRSRTAPDFSGGDAARWCRRWSVFALRAVRRGAACDAAASQTGGPCFFGSCSGAHRGSRAGRQGGRSRHCDGPGLSLLRSEAVFMFNIGLSLHIIMRNSSLSMKTHKPWGVLHTLWPPAAFGRKRAGPTKNLENPAPAIIMRIGSWCTTSQTRSASAISAFACPL